MTDETPGAEELARGAGGHLSDLEIADRVRMLMRTDLDHEAVCVMARDRIKYLSGRLTAVERQLREADAAYALQRWQTGDEPWPGVEAEKLAAEYVNRRHRARQPKEQGE